MTTHLAAFVKFRPHLHLIIFIRSQISSKWLHTFYDNLNNVHLTDVDNCLASNSLCHYIDSDFAYKFCFQNNQSNFKNFTSVCLNFRSIVNKEHYNLFKSLTQSLKFLPDIIAINKTGKKIKFRII